MKVKLNSSSIKIYKASLNQLMNDFNKAKIRLSKDLLSLDNRFDTISNESDQIDIPARELRFLRKTLFQFYIAKLRDNEFVEEYAVLQENYKYLSDLLNEKSENLIEISSLLKKEAN